MPQLSSVVGRGAVGSRPAAGTVGALYFATDVSGGQLQRDNGSTWDAVEGAGGGSGLYTAYLCYQDQKTANTDGGTFTSGAWRTRDLNTEVADTANHGVLAANQITLDAGTYRVFARAPAFNVGRHQARLQNITDSATLVHGASAITVQTSNVTTDSIISSRFTIAGAKVIELQHLCYATEATDGFGLGAGGFIAVALQIFSSIELWME